jgi:hypothetical protein
MQVIPDDVFDYRAFSLANLNSDKCRIKQYPDKDKDQHHHTQSPL